MEGPAVFHVHMPISAAQFVGGDELAAVERVRGLWRYGRLVGAGQQEAEGNESQQSHDRFLSQPRQEPPEEGAEGRPADNYPEQRPTLRTAPVDQRRESCGSR